MTTLTVPPLTPHQAKYFAYSLTRLSVDDDDRLSRALFDAAVDLNPHQIEAALFALQSPFAQGVLLADEVGLGKTIEAGIVLCQLWAERKRRLLVLCPAALRTQWAAELREKFNLPAVVLEARTARAARQAGQDPLAPGAVVVMSYQFGHRLREEVRGVDWHLVVIDEAQNLRGVYRPKNVVGQGIRWATSHCRKLLLSATPLQNSLKELFGLASLIDERLFGDLASFQEQYMGAGANLAALQQRLTGFCRRTLRRQVKEYVNYTDRKAITRPFRPTDDEHALYEAVSAFLRRPDSYAVPQRQRHLTELLLRKMLASSAIAIAETLDKMRARLEALLRRAPDSPLETLPDDALVQELLQADDFDEELLDEILYSDSTRDDENDDDDDNTASAHPPAAAPPPLDYARLREEIDTLADLAAWARRLQTDTKAAALTQALRVGFEQMQTLGANRKALIFTESRRTQEFLRTFLETNGYAGQVALFNGANNSPEVTTIYEQWLARHRGTARVSGSRTVDVRAALVEHFCDAATILIATEAAAEGLNLQFCSLVVNYDLPWNPQRVEQRIGRCHRYGQRHEVVVINFLNERNHADQRVLELLTEKFRLFNSVFDATDEVIGAIHSSGLDFERQVLAIYQQCRTPEAIQAAFDRLRDELDEQIKARMAETRQLLFDHFDDDVHQRLRLRLADTQRTLDRFGARFWALTRHQLYARAAFDDARLRFDLHRPPQPHLAPGRYYLISRQQPEPAADAAAAPTTAEPVVPAAPAVPTDGLLYRLSHPLGEWVLATAKQAPTPLEELVFDVTSHPTRLLAVEALRGRAGYLTLTRLCLAAATAADSPEEYLLFSAFEEAGESVEPETCEKLLTCAAHATGAPVVLPTPAAERLRAEAARFVQATISQSLERNNRFFQEACEKLQRWADDLLVAAGKALRDTQERLRQAERDARLAPTLADQHTAQERIRALERQQRRHRQDIFDREDEIRDRRDELIRALEKRLSRQQTVDELFTVRWRVV